MLATCCDISSVAREVWLASAFTSEATTAKPLPAAPARAASMVALSASRLVCDAIVEMMLTMEPLRSAVSLRDKIACWVRWVSPTAALAMSRPRVASWPICWIDAESSSVASPVIFTRCVVSAAADDATAMRLSVSPATSRMLEQVAVSEVEASVMACRTSPIAPAKSPIASSIAILRNELRARGKLGWRIPVLACERVERRAQHIVSCGAAQTGVEAERGFLLDGFSARYEIGVVEFAVQQRFQMRQFELLDEITVLYGDRADFRHARGGLENGFDRLFEVGSNRGP